MTENAPLNVFITGATGALGREVTRQLKAAGHRVTGTTTGYENAAIIRADGGIPAYPDLLRTGEIRSILVAGKTDVIINLEPQVTNHLPQRGFWHLPLLDEAVVALEAAAQAAGVKFIVHTSYAFADEKSDALAPLLKVVKAGETAILKGTVPGCVLRLGFVYGAESEELLDVRDTLMMGRMVDSGPDNSRACWINVPDAARAVILAALQRPAGQCLTIVEDQAASPAAFLGYFASSQGVSRPSRAPRFAPWAQPTKEQIALMSLSPHVSNADAKTQLGWALRFPTYQQGIDDTLLTWRGAAEAAAN